MKLKQEMIEKLRNGEASVRVNGDDRIFYLLDRAFPSDKLMIAHIEHNDIISRHPKNDRQWVFDKDSELEKVEVEDFFEDELPNKETEYPLNEMEEFKNGDEIEVRTHQGEWKDAVYIAPSYCNDNVRVWCFAADSTSSLVAYAYPYFRHKQPKKPLKQELTELREQLDALIKRIDE